MKKSLLQKPIREILEKNGFTRVKGDDYESLSPDGGTKIIIRIPDGKKGFIIGAQFAHIGAFDGLLSHAAMKQFDFAYELAFASVKEYEAEEITDSALKVIEAYKAYAQNGEAEIKNRIDEWTFGDTDENEKDILRKYLGLSGIDPYSDEYFEETLFRMANGGSKLIPLPEYAEHKDFYDGYTEHGASISANEKDNTVTIFFPPQKKWYQQ